MHHHPNNETHPSCDDVVHTATAHNPYNEHLQHCSQCRTSHTGQCEEGDRALHESVLNGTAGEYDRELDKERNPHLQEED